jgi:hypothetical protein
MCIRRRSWKQSFRLTILDGIRFSFIVLIMSFMGWLGYSRFPNKMQQANLRVLFGITHRHKPQSGSGWQCPLKLVPSFSMLGNNNRTCGVSTAKPTKPLRPSVTLAFCMLRRLKYIHDMYVQSTSQYFLISATPMLFTVHAPH